MITLAIIGIVAALTIPSVVAKYNQHAQYTQFMKAYNTLSTALSLAVNDYGDPMAWSNDPSLLNLFEKYLGKYLKDYRLVTGGELYPSEGQISDLHGDTFVNFSDIADANFAVLPDGSAIMIAGSYFGESTNILAFYVDINGKKGPNTLGRDVYAISYGAAAIPPDYNKKPRIILESGQDIEACCSTTQSCPGDIPGSTCGAKLLKEGKMNY